MKTLHVLHSDLCCQQFPFSSCALRQVLAEGTHLRACVGPEAPCTGGTCNACSQRQSVCCLAQSGGEEDQLPDGVIWLLVYDLKALMQFLTCPEHVFLK